jgi:hypothetical protein
VHLRIETAAVAQAIVSIEANSSVWSMSALLAGLEVGVQLLHILPRGNPPLLPLLSSFYPSPCIQRALTKLTAAELSSTKSAMRVNGSPAFQHLHLLHNGSGAVSAAQGY